ncbi:MAG: nucleotidyltransferase family protein [Hyphomonadaceae bacterium]
MTRADLLERLKALKPWLEAQGLSRVRLFGSYARDAARPESDVDLLVELSRPMGAEFFALQAELSRRLGLRVEMFTNAELHRIVLRQALAEAIDA